MEKWKQEELVHSIKKLEECALKELETESKIREQKEKINGLCNLMEASEEINRGRRMEEQKKESEYRKILQELEQQEKNIEEESQQAYMDAMKMLSEEESTKEEALKSNDKILDKFVSHLQSSDVNYEIFKNSRKYININQKKVKKDQLEANKKLQFLIIIKKIFGQIDFITNFYTSKIPDKYIQNLHNIHTNFHKLTDIYKNSATDNFLNKKNLNYPIDPKYIDILKVLLKKLKNIYEQILEQQGLDQKKDIQEQLEIIKIILHGIS